MIQGTNSLYIIGDSLSSGTISGGGVPWPELIRQRTGWAVVNMSKAGTSASIWTNTPLVIPPQFTGLDFFEKNRTGFVALGINDPIPSDGDFLFAIGALTASLVDFGCVNVVLLSMPLLSQAKVDAHQALADNFGHIFHLDLRGMPLEHNLKGATGVRNVHPNARGQEWLADEIMRQLFGAVL